ncbi:MAG: hypothetical protein ACW98Y_17275 [Candidatus Thorarchaeota archaeon]|jgi:predicted alpha/beta-fold hydrolase
MTFELEILDIKGYDGKDIFNSLLKQKKGPGPISVIFPGLHYNVDMPLLYYSTGVLLEAGHSVLSVDTRYSHKENFKTAESMERTKWMCADAKAVLDAVNALEDYQLSVFVGKSLGTIQMSYLVDKHDEVQNSKMVWLTPLLAHDWVVEQMTAHQGKSFIVIGTADPQYDDNKLAKIVEAGRSTLLNIPNGNHSLDVPAGLIESMKKNIEIMGEMREFVKG